MNGINVANEVLLHSLEERAKELNCLYLIEEALADQDSSFESTIDKLISAIPLGWKYSEKCVVRIEVEKKSYQSPGFKDTPWVMASHINVQGSAVGTMFVHYTEELPLADDGPFLKDEWRLMNTISDRIGHFILHQRLKKLFQDWKSQQEKDELTRKPEWIIVLDLLKKTDQTLFSIISRKMLNNLFCKGIPESKDLFAKLGNNIDFQSTETELNRPSKKQVLESSFNLGYEIFDVAADYFTEADLLAQIQKWIHEEKSHFLVKALANQNTPLAEIADAIRKYHHTNPSSFELASPIHQGIRVSLIRRFLTDQLEYIDIAKNNFAIGDFYDVLQNVIFPTEGHGKLGGKSAGLLLAKRVIEKYESEYPILKNVKIPKTWYITSDGLMSFVYYNNLEDVIEQKYKQIDEVRQEYPHIIQAFKNSHFPAEIMNGLSRALDDFGNNPIIVRSSSLLEDRLGSAFAGKYKSLFLANQGNKSERLEALMDAIAEVYASTFGPDPIGYRTERNLLDFNEEMGIMIQEVVGVRAGKYFLPAFAGVAFTNNEFRWSPRIKREDGLLRLVPGLGTRAVDRIGDDYPILVAPGQSDLRVNLTYQDMRAYTPKNIDVINLDTNTFETIQIRKLIEEVGNRYPMLNEVFSIVEENHVKHPIGLGIDTRKHDIIVTFENLVTKTQYISQLKLILAILTEKLKTPVDLEFASDGKSLYLLQSRPQSSAKEGVSAVIPKDIPKEKLVFTANRYVSNGKVPDINYIVYVDPEEYSSHSDLQDLKDIGRAVGLLNKFLPKKSFILMGPGRWGSRDDIRLGVKATYSDINNTAVLIEIAKKKGNYTPDLSFGTHFFQDLVESSIRYLPLYPDDEKVVFNYDFLMKSENVLTRFLPDFEHISNTLKVINVREATDGMVLRILMNADEDYAAGILIDASANSAYNHNIAALNEKISDEPLRWRMRMVDAISSSLNPDRFGLKALYLYGTVYNQSAGANSDIDLIAIFDGDDQQKHDLMIWFEGWNASLSTLNYNRSGYRLDRFIDLTILSEQELREQSYYAEIVQVGSGKSKKLKLYGK